MLLSQSSKQKIGIWIYGRVAYNFQRSTYISHVCEYVNEGPPPRVSSLVWRVQTPNFERERTRQQRAVLTLQEMNKSLGNIGYAFLFSLTS